MHFFSSAIFYLFYRRMELSIVETVPKFSLYKQHVLV